MANAVRANSADKHADPQRAEPEGWLMHRAIGERKLNLSDALESLRSRLASTSAGKLEGQDKSRVEGNLAQCWDDLEGSNEGGMQWSKLIGRTENLRWETSSLNEQQRGDWREAFPAPSPRHVRAKPPNPSQRATGAR
jgi:hypothetical protein